MKTAQWEPGQEEGMLSLPLSLDGSSGSLIDRTDAREMNRRRTKTLATALGNQVVQPHTQTFYLWQALWCSVQNSLLGGLYHFSECLVQILVSLLPGQFSAGVHALGDEGEPSEAQVCGSLPPMQVS